MRFDGNINFNAQHSPTGAFMSFTLGHFGTGGGIGVEIGRPASQNVFVGVKQGDRTSRNAVRCLPFFRGTRAAGATSAADYDAEHVQPPPALPSIESYTVDKITRHYGWATDAWATDDFTFSIYTPFGSIPDPTTADTDALRAGLLPAVVATVHVDNRKGTETKTAVFAIDFVDPGARILQAEDGADTAPTPRLGFAWRRKLGVLGTLDGADDPNELFALQRWSVAEGLADINPVHELGTCAGLAFEVPPGEQRTLVLAIGAYLDGIVTTGLEGKYYYTRCCASLKDVLDAALDAAADLRSRAAKLDAKLAASALSPHQQFLIAHSTRSYYGSTQLLDVGGQPFFVVNEGEYCMMNTLDLAVDHVFWELKHNPWVVKNLLDNFVRYYSYHDQLKSNRRSTDALIPGGMTFCHDMGAHNNFSRFGHSSYELPNLTGCFSYMSLEQLCNWILLAACYVNRTGDRDWLRKNRPTIEACAQSMLNRGGDLGFAQFDSSRCQSGAEITTYDSLDHSLAQTRNNLYIAVKSWASYLGLAEMFETLGDDADKWLAAAARVAKAVVAHVQADGTIPAVFERDNPGFASRILPAVEGLIYPLYWQDEDALNVNGTFAEMLKSLKRHAVELLTRPGTANLFADGGIKLSSTSNNSWMSKIAIFQHVAREVFELDRDPAVKSIFERADAAHVKWQTDGSAYWACSDQIINGTARGSRYYPRIVTTALWMERTKRAKTPVAVRPDPTGAPVMET